MSKETKKKSQEPREANATYVHTFRGDTDKAVGVTVWYQEGINGGEPSLFYNQSRSYPLRNSTKLGYTKNKFYRRHALGHAEALTKADAFMEEHAINPDGAIEAAKRFSEPVKIEEAA